MLKIFSKDKTIENYFCSSEEEEQQCKNVNDKTSIPVTFSKEKMNQNNYENNNQSYILDKDIQVTTQSQNDINHSKIDWSKLNNINSQMNNDYYGT